MADEAAPEGESAPVAEEAAPAGTPPSMFTVSVVSAKGLPEGTASAVSFKYSMLTEEQEEACLLYTSPSPRDATLSRMPSSA